MQTAKMSDQNSTVGDRNNCSPVYVDYEKFLTTSAKRRQPAALRKIAVFMHQDGYIKMGGGFPNPLTFPLAHATFTLTDGTIIEMDQKELQHYQQYSLSQGYPELRKWMLEFQQRFHSPPTLQQPDHPGQFDLVITNGSNEGINFAFEMLLEPGDWLLVEEATYASAVAMIKALNANMHGVKADSEGMLADDLDLVLTSWNDLHPGVKKPKVIYVVTSGGNPTGVTWSVERKRAIYDVARAHDLIILEDDAYYFLTFTRPLLPSFLSMDVDGRVLRFDTFSKLLGPGYRLAVACGPAPLLQKMRLQKDVSSLSPSGLSQGLLVQMLRHWGYDGFLRHVDGVMEFYKHKAEVAMKCAQKHLAGLADWNRPTGGLFLWLRVHGVKDSEVIVQRALERGLILVGGVHFTPANHSSSYIRISVVMVTEEECDQAFKLLAQVIEEKLANQS